MRIPNTRRRFLAIGSIALGVLVCHPVLSNEAAGAQPAALSTERTPIEVFHGPRPKHIVAAQYPVEDRREGGEGWVKLGFMVDTQGKPFEITVLDSAGDRSLERVAIRSLGESTFEPGTFNGQPTESGSEMTYKFMLSGRKGAQPEFIAGYKSLLKAVAATDRPAADTAMGKLRVTNLYEDAYFGLARYTYARAWGTDVEQLAALRRAVENDGGEIEYLPKAVYRSALAGLFQLEIKTHEYAEAVATWHRLQKVRVDPALEAKIKPVLAQLDALRSDNQEYGVSGSMPSGSWNLQLFKRHFRIQVDDGYISQVKLRCDRHYLYFAFDPQLQYSVNGNYGSCWMELLGAPGSKFTLFQF
jgi:TonB family protein